MEKFLFLDIDGVLNHLDFYNEDLSDVEYRKWRQETPYPLSEFDPKAVSRVNDVLSKSGAKLVVSSSWRIGDKKELSNIFKTVGLPGEFDVTPCLLMTMAHESFCRGDEIKLYLSDKKYSAYCIIDDDDCVLEEQRDNFVHCNFMHGFVDADKKKCIEILNRC